MLTLYVGDKNYSSWSLRPWLAMVHREIPFAEEVVPLFTPEFAARVAAVSPAGLVPVLVDDGFAVWDTLAIVEYLAERFPEKRLWPADARARARARSVCAEMHGGFAALRQGLQMNVGARLPGRGWSDAVKADVDRVVARWTALRAEHGADGPFLFGEFSIADAFFAPVVSRFRTYEVALPAPCAAYADAVWRLPAMQRWVAEARASFRFIAEEEPYRTPADVR